MFSRPLDTFAAVGAREAQKTLLRARRISSRLPSTRCHISVLRQTQPLPTVSGAAIRPFLRSLLLLPHGHGGHKGMYTMRAIELALQLSEGLARWVVFATRLDHQRQPRRQPSRISLTFAPGCQAWLHL